MLVRERARVYKMVVPVKAKLQRIEKSKGDSQLRDGLLRGTRGYAVIIYEWFSFNLIDSILRVIVRLRVGDCNSFNLIST